MIQDRKLPSGSPYDDNWHCQAQTFTNIYFLTAKEKNGLRHAGWNQSAMWIEDMKIEKGSPRIGLRI